MFEKKDAAPFQTVLDGIDKKTLVHGDKTLMTLFRLKAGCVLPDHSHPHEQTGYLVSGRLELIIDGRRHDTCAGDSWCIPSDVSHGARCLEDALAVEVFSPVREDYLPGK